MIIRTALYFTTAFHKDFIPSDYKQWEKGGDRDREMFYTCLILGSRQEANFDLDMIMYIEGGFILHLHFCLTGHINHKCWLNALGKSSLPLFASNVSFF